MADLIKRFDEVYCFQHIDYVNTGKKYFEKKDWDYEILDTGIMIFAGNNSPLTQTVGVRLENTEPETAIDTLEKFYFSKKSDINIELHESINNDKVEVFLKNGFQNVETATVYLKEIDSLPIQYVFPENVFEGKFANQNKLATVLTEGFLNGEMNETLLEIFNIYTKLDNILNYYAVRENEIAGSGFIYCYKDIAMLCGASTLVKYRRQGVQTDLINARMKYAIENGIKYLSVVTENGSASEKSMLKQGYKKLTSRKKYFKKYVR